MAASIQLYRQRHIPEERIPLSGDTVLFLDDSRLITRWSTLKPRKDFASGISIFDFEKHWKITRVARADGSLYHWYCDIMTMHISHDTEQSTSVYTMEDLLIDITVLPDGTVHVLDLDEVADAFAQGLITGDDLILALRAADELLKLIENGGFSVYQETLEKYAKELR
ncbi:MAG: DUF402 domain-containing protein [Lachnospiraceae bacterium]|nr:DUF402 domain-containing protein [Lachnospiraceae bacterium]